MSQISSFSSIPPGGSASDAQALPPQLPPHIEVWSTRALAAWLDISISTVKYHARQAFRGHNGRWEFNREQAQRVVNRIFQFGQVRTLSKNTGTKTTGSKITGAQITHNEHLDSLGEQAQEPDLQKIERVLNAY